MAESKRPVMLIVRDGWGKNPFSEWDKANATVLAAAPVDRRLMADYPSALIKTCGEDVGLPAGVMGNSEVGHQNIGAGRIVDQEIMRITRTIRDGSFYKNPQFLAALEHARRNNSSLHIMGLFSDGRVHADMEHAFALIDLCRREGFPSEKLFIHVITDGRDTAPQSGKGFVESLEKYLADAGVGRVASVIGRYYIMDRDHRWDRVKKAYDLLTLGTKKSAPTAAAAVDHYYAHPTEPSRTGDEFIEAVSIAPDGKVADAQKIKSGDAVIFFNYRGDRPREICKALMLDDAAWAAVEGGGFDRGKKIEDLYFVGMSNYERGLPIRVAFDKPPKMPNILGEVVAAAGLKQFRAAETEKFPHVTFFFNDYREEPFPGEDRKMAPSPKDVSTYDQKPEMAARQITADVLQAVESGLYDVFIVNFANGDMVGHTGVLAAAVKAVETVDACVGSLVAAMLARKGAVLVTADHGNCEQMTDPATGGPHTAHTVYDVNVIVVDEASKGKKLREGGRLADIAPTMLDLLGLPKPAEMTGESLLKG